ncbi:MAG: GC-type dockerin domain-anchored protein [Phycisphaerales bacterium JB040]
MHTLARILLTLLASSAGAQSPEPGSRLAPGTRVGVIYSASDPVSGAPAAPLWDRCLVAGADTYQLAIPWTTLEPAPGVIDTAVLESLLGIIVATRMTPYLVIQTANTNLLDAPADLKDPSDPSRLRPGLAWDSPEVLARFGAVLDAVSPLLHDAGGFCLIVGNEVDVLLSRSSAEAQAFAGFVRAARDRVHALAPPGEAPLAVGANLTFEALERPANAGVAARVLPQCDWASFTYYPTHDFGVLDPSLVGEHLDAFLALAGDKPVLLQEVGYPSGWRDAPAGTPGAGPGAGPGNGSSESAQGEFLRELRGAVLARPRIRFVSVLQLADWSGPTLDFLEGVYGLSDPRFREFLGTLGLAWEDATPKAGFPDLLDLISGLRRTRADLNRDGVLDNGDIGAFVAAFLTAHPDADVLADGVIDNGDIASFVELFAGG